MGDGGLLRSAHPRPGACLAVPLIATVCCVTPRSVQHKAGPSLCLARPRLTLLAAAFACPAGPRADAHPAAAVEPGGSQPAGEPGHCLSGPCKLHPGHHGHLWWPSSSALSLQATDSRALVPCQPSPAGAPPSCSLSAASAAHATEYLSAEPPAPSACAPLPSGPNADGSPPSAPYCRCPCFSTDVCKPADSLVTQQRLRDARE